MTAPKISVVTWDGGFRERFHTPPAFANQTLDAADFEFIWAHYTDDIPGDLSAAVEKMPNGQILTLGGQGPWHAGRCMNAGVSASQGDLLVIVDGDVVPEPDFLERIQAAHAECDELVIYVRRWDEYQEDYRGSADIEHLRRVCRLVNPTNYGGCVCLSRSAFEDAGGYEEHAAFAGPGAISGEFYLRLRNLGYAIKWHPMLKIFHPWHEGTLPSTDTLPQLQQRWIMDKRALMVGEALRNSQPDLLLADFMLPRRKMSVKQRLKRLLGGR